VSTNIIFILCEIALVSGIFLAFSDFIMKSLAAANPAGGIESMQIINRKVFKTIFMVLFIGMAVLSPILMGHAYLHVSDAASVWIMAGSATYFMGVFTVTAVFNVPMNKHLALLDFTSPGAGKYWMQTYVPRWTFWNSVRTTAAGVAAICFLLACTELAQMP
jgi:uncharacterized membrane protein